MYPNLQVLSVGCVSRVLSVTARREPYMAQLEGRYKCELKVQRPSSTYWTARLEKKKYSHVRVFNSNVFNLREAWALYEWCPLQPWATVTRTRKERVLWSFRDGTVLRCPPGHALWSVPLGSLVIHHLRCV